MQVQSPPASKLLVHYVSLSASGLILCNTPLCTPWENPGYRLYKDTLLAVVGQKAG